MPHLRFNRDRRGYETTALVEAGGRRRKGQRLLYFFRTPPAVRVGREALDPEAMRLLEEHNPDVSFDWSRLLKQGSATASAAPAPASPREERRRDRRDQRRARPEPPPRPATTAKEYTEYTEHTQDRATEYTEYTEYSAPATSADAIASAPIGIDESETAEPAETAEPVEPVEPGEPAEPVPARFARLGAEGLTRLRARYAEINGRLAAKEMPEEERAELFDRVERLNPDVWQTADEVARALEDYETVFESLRPFIGRPPRRRRL